MILLFLGNWRLTLIILASIPLSMITAVLLMGAGGETLNTMTLGGFALAVGILVDNGTVVIENIERHVGLGAPLERAIVRAQEKWAHRRSLQRCASASSSCRYSCSGNGQVPLLAPVGVGDRVAAGEPGALLHAGARAVQVPDALVGMRARDACTAARRWRARIRCIARTSPSSAASTAFASSTGVCFAGRSSTSGPRCWRFLRSWWSRSRFSRSSGAISFPRSMPVRCVCTYARHPARASSRHRRISRRWRRPSAAWSAAADRRHPRQHRAALQRYQYRAE